MDVLRRALFEIGEMRAAILESSCGGALPNSW
jgi:hypothetical protein